MKNLFLLSLILGTSISLSGCGHHVIYQQVVKTNNSQSFGYEQQTSMLLSNAPSRPQLPNNTPQALPPSGVRLQQQMPNGMIVPATPINAIITPQQQRTLMLVPVSSLHHQQVIVQAARPVPMVKIPVLAMPAQANTRTMLNINDPHAFDHLKATPEIASEEMQD